MNENLRGPFQVNDPEEARRIRSKGGKVMDGGSRVISPSGRYSLNMSRALGDADYKTPRRIVSATPDVRHVTLGCGTAKVKDPMMREAHDPSSAAETLDVRLLSSLNTYTASCWR